MSEKSPIEKLRESLQKVQNKLNNGCLKRHEFEADKSCLIEHLNIEYIKLSVPELVQRLDQAAQEAANWQGETGVFEVLHKHILRGALIVKLSELEGRELQRFARLHRPGGESGKELHISVPAFRSLIDESRVLNLSKLTDYALLDRWRNTRGHERKLTLRGIVARYGRLPSQIAEAELNRSRQGSYPRDVDLETLKSICDVSLYRVLVTAMKTFNGGPGISLKAYIEVSIRREVRKFIRLSRGWKANPCRSIVSFLNAMDQARAARKDGRELTVAEIAEAAGRSAIWVRTQQRRLALIRPKKFSELEQEFNSDGDCDIAIPDDLIDMSQCRILPSPSEAFIIQEDLEVLDWAMSQLKPRARWLIKLRCLDGLSHRDVAASVGISVGTAKAGVCRAIQRLKKLTLDRLSDPKIISLPRPQPHLSPVPTAEFKPVTSISVKV